DDFDTEPEESTTALARELNLVPAAQSTSGHPQSALSLSFVPLGQPLIIILPPESIFTDPLLAKADGDVFEKGPDDALHQRI
ncbi:hypothetical protein ACC672_37565, partial [Rhizobium ruizarguesonis]